LDRRQRLDRQVAAHRHYEPQGVDAGANADDALPAGGVERDGEEDGGEEPGE
jgi:hypothetical protein